MKAKKISYKKQKKIFSHTAGNEQVRSLNVRPRPTRGGFRV